MTDLSSLIKRLEEAEGPSRELDALIWCHFKGVKYKGHNKPYQDESGKTQVEFTMPPQRKSKFSQCGWNADPHYPHADPVTSSVDAAISLAERVLPGCKNSSIRSGESEFAAYVWFGDGPFHREYRSENCKSSRAIAVCLATLRAIQSKGEQP